MRVRLLDVSPSGCSAAIAAGFLTAITFAAIHPALAQDGDRNRSAPRVEGLLAVSRQLSPSLRAAALDTAAAVGKGGRRRTRSTIRC